MLEKIITVVALWIMGVISSMGYAGIVLLMAIESACIPLPSEIIMPSLAVGGTQTISLLASYDTINLSSVDSFSLSTGPWAWRNAQRSALRHLYAGGSSWLHQTGLQALDAVDIVELYASGDYTPANGAVYPQSWFGDNLQTIARMAKLDLGLRVATLDLGGWDTHDNQGTNGGYYASQVDKLTRGLHAFYNDLPNHRDKLTVLVMSEFGRTARENGTGGTDHGHGSVMLLLGGKVQGGRVLGNFPGLEREQLFEERDVPVTTDFRDVLAEACERHLGMPDAAPLFPGYALSPERRLGYLA
jgi:uncharacterized protein (DUF1501 family)